MAEMVRLPRESAEALMRARLSVNWDHGQMGQYLGISRETVRRIERGKVIVRQDTAQKLAAGLDSWPPPKEQAEPSADADVRASWPRFGSFGHFELIEDSRSPLWVHRAFWAAFWAAWAMSAAVLAGYLWAR